MSKNVVEDYIDKHPRKDLITLLHVIRTDLDHVAIEVMFPSSTPFSKVQLDILETLSMSYLNDISKLYQDRIQSEQETMIFLD